MEQEPQINNLVSGKDSATFATSPLTLLATAATPQMTTEDATRSSCLEQFVPQVLVRNHDNVIDLSNYLWVNYLILALSTRLDGRILTCVPGWQPVTIH